MTGELVRGGLRAALLLLLAAPLAGCFAQASLGAQRSPDGRWSGSGGLVAGLHFDVNDLVGVGAGGEASISGYSNEDGGGYAVPGAGMATANVKVLRGEVHSMAVAGELTLPHGYVSHTPDRTDEPGQIYQGRAMRASLGLSHRSLHDEGDEGVMSLYQTAGLQTVAIYAPGFDDVTTLGPTVTVGYTMNARAVGRLLDCLLEKNDDGDACR